MFLHFVQFYRISNERQVAPIINVKTTVKPLYSRRLWRLFQKVQAKNIGKKNHRQVQCTLSHANTDYPTKEEKGKGRKLLFNESAIEMVRWLQETDIFSGSKKNSWLSRFSGQACFHQSALLFLENNGQWFVKRYHQIWYIYANIVTILKATVGLYVNTGATVIPV